MDRWLRHASIPSTPYCSFLDPCFRFGLFRRSSQTRTQPNLDKPISWVGQLQSERPLVSFRKTHSRKPVSSTLELLKSSDVVQSNVCLPGGFPGSRCRPMADAATTATVLTGSTWLVQICCRRSIAIECLLAGIVDPLHCWATIWMIRKWYRSLTEQVLVHAVRWAMPPPCTQCREFWHRCRRLRASRTPWWNHSSNVT